MYQADRSFAGLISPQPAERQRASARVAMSAVKIGDTTQAMRVAETGSLRVRFPNVTGPALEAVVLNTAGGIACGDSFALAVDVQPGASVVLTTPAAERVYRSDGATAEYIVRLWLHPETTTCWLPQETILFDRAQLRRRIEVDLSTQASLLAFEAIVFGRAARGETITEGLFEDTWRIRRDGRLVYADTLLLSGDICELLQRPIVAAGAGAFATCVYIAPDAEARLDAVRTLLEDCVSECAASAWNGLLTVRFLAPDVKMLKRDAIAFLSGFRQAPMPRVWHS